MSLPGGFLARPFAHRALHGEGAAENSDRAIEAAARAGWGIEIDIQLTADGRAAVFHDYDLRRLTGREGVARTISMEALAGTPLRGGGFPLALEDALARVAGRVPVLVEVKDQSGDMGPDGGALEDAVAAAAKGYGGPLAAMSFNPHSAARLKDAGLAAGLVTCAWSAEDWPHLPEERRRALRLMPGLGGADFVSHDRADLASARAGRARAAGLPVLCWTIRSEAEAAEALRHADQITFEGYRPAHRRNARGAPFPG
ncbi:glycerophosphoryl diester phosphodiesterase [Hasllibacter halocynthiae]|uniref:Glycerophosphoryl diester phosphodiesterase n=1 Tax=Hasllibacter halocynthiae TaxID=595589 RepID=A0A2T0X245_9RHOB|nr:glycerophosphodiester phosphodiesterase family protein [Hasllibacter halocynthiae]PRY92934.1 glycerophosphoryl diester phosphodiesterase [Hasllibacter halocynthiae]